MAFVAQDVGHRDAASLILGGLLLEIVIEWVDATRKTAAIVFGSQRFGGELARFGRGHESVARGDVLRVRAHCAPQSVVGGRWVAERFDHGGTIARAGSHGFCFVQDAASVCYEVIDDKA
nr:hypothetical protein [Abyssibacter sp.]